MEELKKNIYNLYLNIEHSIDGAKDAIDNCRLKGILKQKEVANLEGQISAYNDVKEYILYEIMKKPR